MITISRQNFLAELRNLLGSMDSQTRAYVIAEYTAMFDNTDDEEALIAKLGSPLKVAVGVSRKYAALHKERAETGRKPEDSASPGGSVPEAPAPADDGGAGDSEPAGGSAAEAPAPADDGDTAEPEPAGGPPSSRPSLSTTVRSKYRRISRLPRS